MRIELTLGDGYGSHNLVHKSRVSYLEVSIAYQKGPESASLRKKRDCDPNR